MEQEENSSVGCHVQNLSYFSDNHDGSSPGAYITDDHDPISSLIPSSSDNVASPQPAKRQTRQWAAWTREEEESFFTALRQVGKNFQKITSRVQSKNKDQVRHYYYRLVRRMNKLLGPGLCLDAKNSKDTNAAMLRWWSLLEKYSCKASKLHLKPRRFKIFVETLEHQLLKDRKKNVKKQSPQGENCSFPSSIFPNQNKLSGNDPRAVKTVGVDGQNLDKAGNGKGSSTRRSLNLGITKSSSKRESFPMKSTRQRRKSGVLSTAAIKKWEKAAMAGVSLVADAAEHVERTSERTRTSSLDGLTVLSAQAIGCSMGQNNPGPSGQAQANLLIKLKLQLFPIDDNTRKALEMDNHNPHLELTLSTRKKISSVLEHMVRKWGSSSVASGELMLFPFDIQRENIMAYQRWTRDSIATAAEVYAMIRSPPIFRLRYGWIVAAELQSAISEAALALPINTLVDGSKEIPVVPTIVMVQEDEMEKHASYSSGVQSTEENSPTAACSKANSVYNIGKANSVNNIKNNLLEPAILYSIPKRKESTSSKIENVVNHVFKKTPTFSAGQWADSLTNGNIGDLLPEIPDNAIANCIETPLQTSCCLEEIAFTCESFDAAIAAHIYSQHKSGFSRPSPQLSSIWDAEETCDEFTFRKSAAACKQGSYTGMAACSLACDRNADASSADIDNIQDVPEEAPRAEDNMGDNEDNTDDCSSETEPSDKGNPSKDFSSLTDIYWPESLGPLELDVPSCKYYSEDLILSDSLSGLNRLIASSLDAFQHCPLFGLDDKGPSPASTAQLGASFAGKIGTGDNAGVPSLQV